MANKPVEISPLAQTIKSVVEETVTNGINITFSKDPDLAQRDIIEYGSRMRVLGLEKFNGPCYVAAVNFYLGENQQKQQDAYGAVVIFVEESAAGRILKGFGHKGFDEDDDDAVLAKCGELVKAWAENLLNKVRSSGYPNLIVGAPILHKNDIGEGIPFPYSQHVMQEATFYFFKNKALVVNAVLPPAK